MTNRPSVGQTIINQIGRMLMMELGFHNPVSYTDQLHFNIRAIVPGTRRVRILKVVVKYNQGTDLYDVTIGYLKKRVDWIEVENLQGIYVDQMVDTMRKYR